VRLILTRWPAASPIVVWRQFEVSSGSSTVAVLPDTGNFHEKAVLI